MDDFRVVYTLSDRDGMPLEAIRSIRTLTGPVTPEQVVVFYTPPIDEESLTCLKEMGVDLRVRENETAPRPGVGAELPTHYGEKSHLCSVDAESIVFLDCDTVVPGDITELLNGEGDFRCRHDHVWFGDSHPVGGLPEAWNDIFSSFNLEAPRYIPQGGVIVFQNYAHKQIETEWRRYLAEPHPGSQHRRYLPENVALALAVVEADLTVDLMTAREHVYEFEHEFCPDGVVYHAASPGEGRPQTVRGNLYLASLYLRNALKRLRH